MVANFKPGPGTVLSFQVVGHCVKIFGSVETNVYVDGKYQFEKDHFGLCRIKTLDLNIAFERLQFALFIYNLSHAFCEYLLAVESLLPDGSNSFPATSPRESQRGKKRSRKDEDSDRDDRHSDPSYRPSKGNSVGGKRRGGDQPRCHECCSSPSFSLTSSVFPLLPKKNDSFDALQVTHAQLQLQQEVELCDDCLRLCSLVVQRLSTLHSPQPPVPNLSEIISAVRVYMHEEGKNYALLNE
jgi:hypothetical protein